MTHTPPKKLWIALLAALLLLCVAVFFLFSRYVFLGGRLLERSSETLELRDSRLRNVSALSRCTALRELELRGNPLDAKTVTELQNALPNCHIHWDVPVDGQRLDSESRVLTVASLDMDDWENLTLFPDLQNLYVLQCDDFSRLEELEKALPDCEIHCAIELAGRQADSCAPMLELTGTNVSCSELSEKLVHFYRLGLVHLGACGYTTQERIALQKQYPNIRFTWTLELAGQQVENTVSTLRFDSSTLSDTAELREKLSLFPYLRQLDLSDCGFTLSELNALMAEYPHVHFRWNYTLLGRTFCSDDREIDLSGIEMTDSAAVEAALPYFPYIKKVVMCNCGLDNATMDALNKKYEDVRFVWMVQVWSCGVRTDATYFTLYNPETRLSGKAGIGALRYCTDMVAADLGHMGLTSADAEIFYYMPHLRYLIISVGHCEDITPVGSLKELEYFEAFYNSINDLTPLLGCTRLKDLNLCHNRMLKDDAIDVLVQMKGLERLWFYSHSLSEDYLTTLQEALPNCEIQYFQTFDSATEYGWRTHERYYEMRDALHMYYMNYN